MGARRRARMCVLMRIDYEHYNSPRFIYPAISVTTVLLVMVFFFRNSHATHRWIRFGGFFSFQPSELAKPVLILFLAWFLHTRLEQMRDWKNTLLRSIFIPLIFILLIVKQPDLGTALVLAGVTAMILVLAGMEWKWLLAGIAASLPPLAVLLFWSPGVAPACSPFSIPAPIPRAPASTSTSPSSPSAPAASPAAVTWRACRSSSTFLKLQTDFIFANIGEELGFIGAMVIVTLFVVFAVRGLRVAFRARIPSPASSPSASPPPSCFRPSSTSAWSSAWCPPRASRSR